MSDEYGPGTGHSSGDVAQLGERSVRNAEVEGSNPFVSTRQASLPDLAFFETIVSKPVTG